MVAPTVARVVCRPPLRGFSWRDNNEIERKLLDRRGSWLRRWRAVANGLARGTHGAMDGCQRISLISRSVLG